MKLLTLIPLLFFLLFSCKQDTSTPQSTSKLLIPDFPAAEIDHIQIQGKYGELNIHRKDSHWFVKELQDYPAKSRAVSQLLTTLSTSSIVEKIPNSLESLSDFGLSEPTKTHETKPGTWLRLRSRNGFHLDLLIGALQKSGSDAALHFGDEVDGHSFVRLANSPDILSIDTVIRGAHTIINGWIDDRFLTNTQIRQITYLKNDKPLWNLDRPDINIPFTLKNGNETHTFPNLTPEIGYALAGIQLDQPVGPISEDQLSENFPEAFDFETVSGVHYRLYLGSNRPVSEEEKEFVKNATGFLAPALPTSKTTVVITAVPGKPSPENLQTSLGTPWLNHQHLAVIPVLNKIRLSKEELLLYESMLKE